MWTVICSIVAFAVGIYTPSVWNAAKASVLEQLARYFRS